MFDSTIQMLVDYFSIDKYVITTEDEIVMTFRDYEGWRDARLTLCSGDEKLTPAEMVDLYYEEMQDGTVDP